jgi:hypothetical protein
VRQIPARGPHHFRQDDVRRQVRFPSAQIGERTPDVRRIHAAAEQPTGLEHLMPRIVNRGSRVIARADNRKLVGNGGMSRQDLGKLKASLGRDRREGAANFRGRLWLRVERVDLARRAKIENHDYRAIVMFLRDQPLLFCGRELRQRQADRAERPDLHKIAARDTIAGMSRSTVYKS